MAKDNLKRLLNMNQTTFSFDNYVTKMKQICNVLENYNVPLYEDYKVMQLLGNIHFPNNDLKTKVNICRSIHSASFETAYQAFSHIPSHNQEVMHRDVK